MKKLKKFNENWIDDEIEDTNYRMSELDKEEGIDVSINNEEEEDEEMEKELVELQDNIINLLNGYINKHNRDDIDYIELLKFLFTLS